MLREFIHKLLLLTLLFCSFFSKASDSLKVKKIEYFEEGKLVRAIFHDSLGRISKQLFMDYKENFAAKAKNEIQLVKFKDGKHYCFENYFVNIYGDSVLFYNPINSGYIQYLKYNSKGQNIETPYIIYKLNWNYYNKLIKIDSLEFVNEIDKGYNFKILFYYDSSGNEIMQKAIDRGKVNKIVLKKFNIEGEILNFESKDLLMKEVINLNYTYEKKCDLIQNQRFIKRKLIENSIQKIIKNDNLQELRKETYQIPLKKSKPIGEPKLTFTQENIYENDRIVKIIYTDYILNKTKIHELKYEFYN